MVGPGLVLLLLVVCSAACPPHHYGADCKQRRVCFCKNQPFCDIHTGTCVQDNGECRQGWKNRPFCDKSYPLLLLRPSVSGIGENQAKVTFDSWHSLTDTGEGKPVEYRVEYKAPNGTWNSKTVPARSYRGRQSVLLNQLRPYTKYMVRVLVMDEDKNYREHGASIAQFETACGEPARPPGNISIDNSTATKIVVKWTNPARKFWNCWSASAELEIGTATYDFNLTASFRGRPNNTYAFTVTPYTAVNIRMRLRTPNKKYSNWTMDKRVVSAEDAPSEPRDVRIQRAGPRTVVLGWRRPAQENGVLRNYSVVYTSVNFLASGCGSLEERDTRVVVPPTQLNVNLTGLRPFTKYRVSVSAWTIMAGNASVTTFNTAQAAPDGVPTDLRHTNISIGSVMITWSEVPCEFVNGEIRGYYVHLESDDEWETKRRSERVRDKFAAYTDLLPYTRYQVKVVAVNVAGRSLKFATLDFTTDPKAPPAPTDLAADHLSQVIVMLSWNAPYPPYGVLHQYQLQYWGKDARRVVDIVHVNCARRKEFLPRHCYTVHNLTADKFYNFSVRAQNEGTGYSPYSDVLGVETKLIVPEAPINVQSLDESENSLRIQWEPPLQNKGMLTGYQVNATLSHSFNQALDETWEPQSSVLNGSDTLELTLRDLLPGSTYLVCVQASTIFGFGGAACNNMSTKTSLPDAPENITFLDQTEESVIVRWEPPFLANGRLTGYKVNASLLHTFNATLAESFESMSVELNSSELTEFSLLELYPSSRYLVCVEARTAAGFGELLCKNLTTGASIGRSHVRGETGTSLPHIAGGSLGLMVLLAVATGVTCYCRRKTEKLYYSSTTQMDGAQEDGLSDKLAPSVETPKQEVRHSQTTGYLSMARYPAASSIRKAGGTPSNPAAIKGLREYVTEALAGGSLLQEYMSLRSGPLYPTSIAKREENKSKNNFRDVLPYDHSRVVLACSDEIQTDDYINASYIPGFKNPNEYIAAEGPTPNTILDFWRLVWQEHVSKIIMISGRNEEDEVAYWPESEQDYAAVTVTVKNSTLRRDFVVRELELSVEDKTRRVTQFHYVAWPRGSTSPHTDSLRSFITAVRSCHPGDPHPVVVHDRERIGRTGTFILIDSMICQAEAEGEVDCIRQLHGMRHARMNMVEEAEQYIFAHKMLVEVLCSKNRKLSIEKFLKLYPHLKAKHPATGKTPISKEFEHLSRARPHPGASVYKAARDEKNASKNRTLKILAADYSRYRLRAENDTKKTDYINAVYVDGFKNVNAYLVTQFPLKHTVEDFWEMICISGSITLVTLGPIHHEEAPQFWPELGCSSQQGVVTVEHVDFSEFPFIQARTLRVSETMTAPRIVKQFHCVAWHRIDKAANSCKIVLDTLRRVEQWQTQAEDAPIVVQCLDGCEKSGLFCVLSSICDQLKNDHEVDVFRCVERVRTSRPEFIIDAEQYVFCYEVTQAFLETLQGYSNVA